MISLTNVTFRYDGEAEAVLRDVTLTIPEGELCLIVGETGSGKSTLLQLVNGLAPHFTGGHLSGTVQVGGRDTRTHPPRDLADLVGVVGQNPASGFVTDRVEDELAYSMEQLGIPAPTMRQRVEEVIDLLALDRIRHRALSTLSAGEQQRVAIGAALTVQPSVLILDEPTSALDPSAAEEVLAALLRLVHDLGITVVVAEHRLERVIHYADSVVLLSGDGAARRGAPVAMLESSPIAPPIIELGRLAGWDPLPLSIRDARRVAEPLRKRLNAHRPDHHSPSARADGGLSLARLRTTGLRVNYGRVAAVKSLDLVLRAGEVTSLMGRNGAGKSSLLWALQGSGSRSGGSVRIAAAADPAHAIGERDVAPGELAPDEALRHIVLVPHNPSDLLYLETVAAECEEADRVAGVATGTASGILERLSPGLPRDAHPRDLSEGQRLAVALSIQLAGSPGVILLDEPTRGLDYAAKNRLGEVLAEHAERGASVLLSSHDVEFVARAAHRVVVLSEGEVITDGPAAEVLTASATFAPQVSRILRPLPFLTVDEVRVGLGASP